MMRTEKSKQGSLENDSWLDPYRNAIKHRSEKIIDTEKKLAGRSKSLSDFASGHMYFGLHKKKNSWVFREWAPYADEIFLIGDFSNWQTLQEFRLTKINDHGVWEGVFPQDTMSHNMHYKMMVHWPGGAGERLPAFGRRMVQDDRTKLFCAQVWDPGAGYKWKHPRPGRTDSPLVYEAHIGMAQEKLQVGTFTEFRDNVLPWIADLGYNTIQVMALQEHPYYGSFGYQVCSLFALSSRFGTPEEFKSLVDKSHSLGIRVIIDIVHSHGVRNEFEGLGNLCGRRDQYFHSGDRGVHRLWDSYCFDYGKDEVLHFLLSNCRFWIDEYNLDGVRFDGITSMLYSHHGLGHNFTGYHEYFGAEVDEDAYSYLALANKVIHQAHPGAITIAEDISGIPGLTSPQVEGGMGFDYRMAMGVSDCWFKLLDIPQENWDLGYLWRELTGRRTEEKTISYVECHDQALVGGKSFFFTLADSEVYFSMHKDSQSLAVEHAMALHKISRGLTLFTANKGYLNFMGNEFGHPEWIDFPREGNNWSYHHARRTWSLTEDKSLRYHFLRDFDQKIIQLATSHSVYDYETYRLVADNQNKILIFCRADLVIIANLHPTASLTDYTVEVLPGSFKLILDSDTREFGGHGRLCPDQEFITAEHSESDRIFHTINLYIPSLSLQVLQCIT